MNEELARKTAKEVIRTLCRYSNFRTYWRNTRRQEVILENLTKTILGTMKEPPKLEWHPGTVRFSANRSVEHV